MKVLVRCVSESFLSWALVLSCLVPVSTWAADVTVSMQATGEEQQVNQPGLIFNNAVFGQVFPTAPNYFVSTRVSAGRRISYQTVVSNPDISASSNVIVNIVIPQDGAIYQGSLSTTLGTCQVRDSDHPDGALVCNPGILNPGQSATINFQFIVSADTPAGEVLTAGANAVLSGDANLNNNSVSALITVLGAADMTVLLSTIGSVSTYNTAQGRIVDTPTANAVTAGNLVQHRVQVQNNGPSSAAAALIKHTLPAGYTFEDVTGARCIPDESALNVYYCELEDMPAGQRRAYDLYVSVDPFVTTNSNLQSCIDAIGSASNTAPPGSNPPVNFNPPLLPLAWDPLNNGNNACTSTTTGALVDGRTTFNKSVVLTDQRGLLHYEPQVRNDGRSGLLGATLIVTFPTGLELQGASSECVVGATTATCSVMPLSPGEIHTFNVVGNVDLVSTEVAALNVTANLSAVSPADANNSNNSTSALTVVQAPLPDDGIAALSVGSSDFDILRGTWGVNSRGDFFSFELGKALALVKASKLDSFRTGTLQAAVRLLRYKKTVPNAAFIFAHQSSNAYRYVKLQKKGRKGRVTIGQVGDFGGEGAGAKASAKYRFKLRRVYNLNVQVSNDGTVAVKINNSSEPVVAHRFAGGAQTGRAGFEAKKARSAFDTLSVFLEK